MNADLFFRTRTTRRTQTCADFFIWIEKINLRSSACSASSACFFPRRPRVFSFHGAFFMAYSEKNAFSACRVRGKLYLYPHASRACGGVFSRSAKPCREIAGSFRNVRNHVAESRGVFAMCETVSRNRGKLLQRAKPCRETAGSFRRVRNGAAKPREAFAEREIIIIEGI